MCRLEVERLQEYGWQKPYESRGSRTDLWGTGGEIPPVHPAYKSEGTTRHHNIPNLHLPLQSKNR